MPLPFGKAKYDTCAYAGCDQTGHVACNLAADHYTRLCAAAQALVATYPADPKAITLQGILSENTPPSGNM